jgi:hypothetical protein
MFSMAEMFLLAWCLVSTTYAVLVSSRYKRQLHHMLLSDEMLIGLFEGHVVMQKLPRGGAKFINKETQATVSFEPRR